MAQVTPRITLPADSDTTGAVQITGASLRCSVRATALTTLALIRMDPSGVWFRITDSTGAPMQFTAQPGGNAGNLDVSFSLPAASSNEWYNLIADSTFAGYAEIDSLSAPPGPGGSVPTSRTLTPAGGVTLDAGTAAVDLSADRTIGLGGTADMVLSTGALGWAGAAGKAGSLVAGSAAALTITANAASTWKVGTAGALTLDGFGGINFKVNTATVADIGVSSASKLTMAANKDVTCAAGTTALDLSLGTGATSTTTGLNTIGGDLLMAAAKIIGFGAPQALSGAGAVNVTTLVTLVTSTGVGDALTMVDGTRAGQLKFVTMVVDGGSSVLTPTTKTNFTTLTLTAAYDWGLMQWSGTAWRPVAFGGTAAFA